MNGDRCTTKRDLVRPHCRRRRAACFVEAVVVIAVFSACGPSSNDGEGGHASSPSKLAAERGAESRIREGPFDAIVAPRAPTRIGVPDSIPERERPNLLIVSIDTLRADRVGVYGHSRPTTPRLDALAAEGVLFENAFSHAPTTAPSHMSLFTGLYPEAHRIRNMFDGARKVDNRWLAPGIPTLAEILRAAGYSTVALTAGGNLSGAIGFARGFDSFVSKNGRGAIVEFREAGEELSRLAKGPNPFFLFVHTYEVHAPYLPPARYRKQFTDPDYAGKIIGDGAALARVSERGYSNRHEAYWSRVDAKSPADRKHLMDLYDAGIRHADDALGTLLDRLDRTGATDRTIVVVLSDHGEEFGEHGAFEHTALWREVLHVPLVMRVPASLRAEWSGRRVSQVVGLVDVLPTLFELLSIPTPDHLHGRSLAPIVEGETSEPDWMFAQHLNSGGAALLTGDWKWLKTRSGSEPLLFDRKADPDEFMGLSAGNDAWRREGAVKVREIVAASRAVWPLGGEGNRTTPTPEMREQLEALGYVDPVAAD